MKATIQKDPKLTAGVERLRNGTSSLTSESKTQRITYNVLQGRLKKLLGVVGYGALMKANHAAQAKARAGAAKPAAKKANAKAVAKKPTRAKAK